MENSDGLMQFRSAGARMRGSFPPLRRHAPPRPMEARQHTRSYIVCNSQNLLVITYERREFS
jgi:hypothetical protein